MQHLDFSPLAHATQEAAHKTLNDWIEAANEFSELSRSFLEDTAATLVKVSTPVATPEALADTTGTALKAQASSTLRYGAAVAKLAIGQAQRNVEAAHALSEKSAAHFKHSAPSHAAALEAFHPVLKTSMASADYIGKIVERTASDWSKALGQV